MKRAVLLLCLTLSAVVFAKDRHMPLSDYLIQSHSVYIENQTGDPKAADAAYSELSSIKSYYVTQDGSRAEILVVISRSISDAGTWVRSTDNANAQIWGNTAQVNSTGNTMAIPLRRQWITVGVFDHRTNTSLWSETHAGSSSGATKACLKSYRKRFDESAKAR